MERAGTLLSQPPTKMRLPKIISIRRHECCVGLSLMNIGRFKIEIWYAPSGYEIKPHRHDHENIRLYFLFGHNVSFFRKRNSNSDWERFDARWYHIGHGFTIRAGDCHKFCVSKFPLIFMNIEEWLNGKPTSAAEDFQLVNEE